MASSYGTTARIVSMGKHDGFFMDEMSVFRNPANMSIYPNMLMGSYGEYKELPGEYSTDYSSLERHNRDPQDAFFGAVLSYSLKQSSDEGSQYPMLSVGAGFNRKDALLDYVQANAAIYGEEAVRNVLLAEPIGKVDILLGYAFPNGGMIGAGAYLAFQNKQNEAYYSNREFTSSIYKGTIGMNWPVASSMDLEASVGIASITAVGVNDTIVPIETRTLAKNDITVQGDLRLFSALTVLNGDFVPRIGIRYMQLQNGETVNLDVVGGIGLNINIDKGFFWAGLDGLYEQRDREDGYTADGIGGRVSFGIERNVVWDFFSIRVGGMKKIMYVKGAEDQGEWQQNPEGDASDDDLVGLGFGFNIENRLKIDFVVAEDVPYTFTNLLSGPMHHVFTRVDATYSF